MYPNGNIEHEGELKMENPWFLEILLQEWKCGIFWVLKDGKQDGIWKSLMKVEILLVKLNLKWERL